MNGTTGDRLATKTDFAELRADLYRALWILGAGVVTVMTAVMTALFAAFELFG